VSTTGALARILARRDPGLAQEIIDEGKPSRRGVINRVKEVVPESTVDLSKSENRNEVAEKLPQELSDAEAVRGDQGQLEEAGVVEQVREETGREDIQRVAEEGREPSDREAQVPEEVGPATTLSERAVRPKQPSRGLTAKKLREEADRGVEPGGLAAVPEATRRLIQTGKVGQARPIDVPNPEIERRMRKAKGVKRATLREKIGSVGEGVRQILRPQKFVPQTEEFASANELFRLHKDIPARVQEDANRDVAAIIDPLTKEDLELFERSEIADNMVASVERGEPLRFGFESLEELRAYQDQLNKLVENKPAVQTSKGSRKQVVQELVTQLVDFGVLPADALNRAETYYHQQVLSFMEAERFAHSRGFKKKKAGFQRRRTKGDQLAEEFDYNTSYIEAEVKWMTDARELIEREKILRELVRLEDKMPEAQAEVKAAKGKGEEASWQDFVPEGHSTWQAEPGNIFYKAFTIPDRLAEQAMVEEEVLVKDENIKRVLSVGRPHQIYIFKDQIVEQLESMEKPKPEGALGTMAREMMRMLKVFLILNPKRAAAYMIRNTTGDVDPIIGGAIPALGEVKGAISDLRKYYLSRRLSIPEGLERPRDLGVISASLISQEIPDLKDLAIFRRFYDARFQATSIPLKSVSVYFQTVKRFNEFRENVLRLAAYRFYLKKMKRGSLQHFGASKRSVVNRLRDDMGNEIAAAHMSRNLLGDYGNITFLGDWLRNHAIPYFAFQEINIKRYPRMFINAASVGDTKALAAIPAALLLKAITVPRIIALYAGFWAYNNLKWPEKEKDLGTWDKQNPHIVVCRTGDGSVRVFRNVGALGDFMEWGGLNTLLSLWSMVEDEQMTGLDLVKEMAKDPVNKAVQSLRPDVKGAFEVSSGMSLFPDVFNPRSDERDELLANILGLRDEYKGLVGRVLHNGRRERPYLGQRMMVGVIHPGRSAIGQMHELRSRFLEKEGRPRPASFPASPTKVMREAAMSENYDAFVEARKVYIEEGGNPKRFLASIRALDPVASRLNERDERKFVNFLTPRQRSQMQLAREYANEIAVRMAHWWRLAAQEEQGG
jgi:hypothetical protein